MNNQVGTKKAARSGATVATQGAQDSNNVGSDRWDHAGFKQLQQEEQAERKIKRTSRKGPVRTSEVDDVNSTELKASSATGKWVHDKNQGEPTQHNIRNSKKDKRPDRVLYMHPGKQGKQLGRNSESRSTDAEEKPMAKVCENRDSNSNLNDDEISEVSSASTNVSSEKTKHAVEEKPEKRFEKQDLELSTQETDVSSRTVSPALIEIETIPFFELQITLTEDTTAELKIYQNHEDLVKTLDDFCSKFELVEEIALHMKIYILKQLREMNYSNFEEVEQYYNELLEHNFTLLNSSEIHKDSSATLGVSWERPTISADV